MAGDVVGPYLLVAPIARGGMGEVFRAEHVVLRRTCAVKVLHARARAIDPCAPDRLFGEARAAARIRHPGVVGIFDAGVTDDGQPFVAMELIDGEPVADLDLRAITIARALELGRQAARALGAAHGEGVVHGDVSPTNLIVGPDGRLTLIDFGLAHVRGDARADTGEMVLGTPAYMAPEQFRGAPSSEESDQYALASVIHELIAGAPPFAAPTLRELYFAKLRATPSGGVPAAIAAVLARALAKDPSHRFASVGELEAALAEAGA